jgi:Cu/Ag efflux protein CusF
MKKTFLKLAAITLLATLIAGPVQAQDKKESKPAAAAEGKKQTPKGIPGHGKLSAVDANAKTISVAGKDKDRTFLVTSQTRILKDNKPATLADAKVGDEVGLYFVAEEKEGKHELLSLRIGAKEGKGAAHKAEKGEKKSEKSDK